MTTRDHFPTVVHTLVLRTAPRTDPDATPPAAASARQGGSVVAANTQLLLLRRAGTGYGDGLYQPPGGYLQAGESPSAAAIRECEEEAGIVIAPDDLQPLCVMPYYSPAGATAGQGVDFIMMAWRFGGAARIGEPHKADVIGWFDAGDLPARAVPFLAPALACWRAGRWYHEFGFAP